VAAPASRPPPDVQPPTLNLTSGAAGEVVTATAAPGAGGAPVAFPALGASDNLTPAAALVANVRCKALAGAGSGWVDAYPSSSASPPPTVFPVGSSLVVCTTKDAATNESPAVAFTVVVSCTAGYGVVNATCTGERRRRAGPRPVPPAALPPTCT
jgi:hypothetical protein